MDKLIKYSGFWFKTLSETDDTVTIPLYEQDSLGIPTTIGKTISKDDIVTYEEYMKQFVKQPERYEEDWG
jgi:hypothetical protein